MHSKYDDIVKQKLGDVRPIYNPDDWAAMEEMLNEDSKAPVAAPWWRYIGIAAVLLLSIGAGVSLLVWNNNNSFELPSQLSTEALELMKQQGAVAENSNNAINGAAEHETDEALNNGADEIAASQDNANNSSLNTPNNNSAANTANSGNTAGTGSNLTVNKPANNNNKPLIAANDDPKREQHHFRLQGRFSGALANAEFIAEPELEKLPIDKPEWDDEGIKNALNQNTILVSAGPSVSVFQSYSSGSDFKREGNSFGVDAQVMFFNRIGVYAGIGKNFKSYRVDDVTCPDGAAYDCPDGYVSDVNAMQIPMGVRVNAIAAPKFNLYAKTGVSLFVNQNEQFNYFYYKPEYVQRPQAITFPDANTNFNAMAVDASSSEGTEPFSISAPKQHYFDYTAGVGMELLIGNKISWQLEPQYAVSLTKVGMQDAKLHSFGVYTSFKYNFFR